ncbi:MAG: NAD-dependent epimerase/dehydratase family protein [Candidatus Heimdallarchaeaceae archaeon]
MTFLITGATGLIGFHIAKMLRGKEEDIEVRGLVRNPQMRTALELKNLGVDIVKGDIIKKESLHSAVKDVDTIFHVAALVREIYPKRFFYTINHQGTINVLDAFERADGDKFVYTSTIGIYGFKNRENTITEDSSLDLIPGYRESKWLGEQEVFKRAREKGFFATAIRPSFVFGPYDSQFGPKVFNLIISSNNKRIPLINGGKALLPLCYVKDMARAHIQCAFTPTANGEAFNCVGSHATQKELFEVIAKEANVSPKFFSINYQTASTIGFLNELFSKVTGKKPNLTRMRAKQFGKSRKIDISKLKHKINFEPEFDLEKSVHLMYQWLKETGAQSVI